MKLYTDVKSKVRPVDIDLESSATAVYVNSNIRTESILVGHTQVDGVMTDLYQNMYIYDCKKYTREEWLFEQMQTITETLIDPVIDPSADIETVIESKSVSIKNGCNRKINNGIDVEINGISEHYSLSLQDQFNMDNILSKVIVLSMTKVIFNSDNSYPRLYTNQEFLTIAIKAREFILRETTYCNFLINYIRSFEEKDRDTILSINYGYELPSDLATQCNEMVEAEIKEYKERIAKHLNIIID